MEDNTKIVLPAIAVRGVIPLPNNEFRIEVGRANSVQALDAAEKMYGGNIILLIQKDATATDVTPDDIEPIGVLAKISLKLKLPNNNYKVKFKVTNRVSISEYTSVDPYFVVNYEKVFSILNGSNLEISSVEPKIFIAPLEISAAIFLSNAASSSLPFKIENTFS